MPRTRCRLGLLAALLALVAACTSDATPDALDDDAHPPEAEGAGGEPIPDVDPDDDDDGDEAARADAGADAGARPDGGAKPPAPTCKVLAVPKAPYLRYGLHPRASDALAHLKVSSGRITQTIGSAAASAGTHAQDGTAEGRPYSAAVDLSVRDMTDAQVSVFLDKLTSVGFVAYFRKPGLDGWPSYEARHIHAIWVGAKMKLSLRNQVRDWRAGKNGLASHTTYTFKKWSGCWRDAIWARYLTANPATN